MLDWYQQQEQIHYRWRKNVISFYFGRVQEVVLLLGNICHQAANKQQTVLDWEISVRLMILFA